MARLLDIDTAAGSAVSLNGIDHELLEAYQNLCQDLPHLAEELLLEKGSCTRGNEAIVGSLSARAARSPVVQDNMIKWLMDCPNRLTALLRDWPDGEEVETFLRSCSEGSITLHRFLPESIVVKFVKPESGCWDPDWGLRAEDAACLFRVELPNGWYLYLQEGLEMCCERPLLRDGYEFLDGAANQQCGYNRFGHLRLADYGAVGRSGTGDEVLRHPREVAETFDSATFHDNGSRDRTWEDNLPFDPDIEWLFDNESEIGIARELLAVWNGDGVDPEELRNLVQFIALTTNQNEMDLSRVVWSVYEKLQDLHEQIAASR